MTVGIPFVKMQGAGNDFVVLESNNIQGLDCSDLAIKFCDRYFGIGGDGLIVIEPSTHADLKMIFFNPDGTRDVCGNGIRCVAKLHYSRKKFPRMSLEIDEDLIFIDALEEGALFRVHMRVREEPSLITCETSRGPVTGWYLNTGTPHFVVFVEKIDEIALSVLGPELEHNVSLPDSASVDFVEIQNPTHVRIKIWERSVGETLACGTAACSVVVAGIQHQGVLTPCLVSSRGGTLTVEYDNSQGLFLTGPAVIIYEGAAIYSKSHQ